MVAEPIVEPVAEPEVDLEVAPDAPEAEENAASVEDAPGALEEPGGEEPQGDEGPPTGEAPDSGILVKQWASALALGQVDEASVPEELREEVSAVAMQIQEHLAAQARERAEAEVQQRLAAAQMFNQVQQHWQDGDINSIDKLEEAEPEKAYAFFAERANRAYRSFYEKQGKTAPPLAVDSTPRSAPSATPSPLVAEAQTELAKLSDRPDVLAQLQARYYSPTAQGLARLKADVAKALANDPAQRKQEAQNGRRAAARVDVSSGKGEATAADDRQKLLDPKTPVAELIKIRARMKAAEQGT